MVDNKAKRMKMDGPDRVLVILKMTSQVSPLLEGIPLKLENFWQHGFRPG